MSPVPRLLFAACLCVCSHAGVAQNFQLAVPLPDERGTTTWGSGWNAPSFAKRGAAVRFQAEHPAWRFRVHALTGSPHRAWGDGIAVPGFSAITPANVADAADRFVRDHAEVLNIDPSQLALQSACIAGGKAYAKFSQVHKGLRVLNTLVELRLSLDGRVFLFGSDAHPAIAVNTTPALGPLAARQFALAGIDAAPEALEIEEGGLAILPLEYPDRIEYRLVYNSVVRVSVTEGWDTYVDAHDGSILWRRSVVSSFDGGDEPTPRASRTVNGKVQTMVFLESWLRGATLQPSPYTYVNVGGREYLTDDAGRFSAQIDGDSADVSLRLAGPWAIARRADTSATAKNARMAAVIRPSDTLTLVWDVTNSTAAERSVFFHINAARGFIRAMDSSATLADLDKQMAGIVNINSECNANWNGKTVNFFRESDKCGNTAEIADVVHHEYGHAINEFLYKKLSGARMRNGALSEATADILTNMLRDEPHIGIGFHKNAGDGTIRNADNTLKYPQNLFGEIHLDGQILTGAVWDMRKLIGLEASRRLTHFVKYGTPDGATAGAAFADYLLELLVADDNDGDLANGTPNGAGIIAAFVMHNIGGAFMAMTHAGLPDTEDTQTLVAVTGGAAITEALAQDAFAIASVRLFSSVDGWRTQSSTDLDYDPATRQFSGFFPPLAGPAVVRYYFEATDNYGATTRLPLTAPASDFQFIAGYRTALLHPFELPDGWTVSGDAKRGVWIRDVPIGTYSTQQGTPPAVPWVQPNTDHTPGTANTRCWVTGNAPLSQGINSNDVDSGKTILTTAMLPVATLNDPLLRYYRWFSNNAGNNPGADPWFVRISSNGGATWRNLEYTAKTDASWIPQVFRLRDYITLSDSVMLSFTATDNSPESTVEAAVDDLEILDTDAIAAEVRPAAIPDGLWIAQNYPNPATEGTSLRISLPDRGYAEVTLASLDGKLRHVAFSGIADAGERTISVVTSTLTAGSYWCRLQWNGHAVARRVLVVR